MPLKKKAGAKSGSAKGTRKKSAAKSATPKVTAQLGDGTLEGMRLQQEFLKKANEWISQNTSRALDLFRRFDVNGDGVLSHEEFRNGMARLKAPFTAAEVEAVIKLIDIDGSGDLDFEEFKNGLRYRNPQPKAGPQDDGRPPLVLIREPITPCPHCNIGLWNPSLTPPRYIMVTMKLMEFRQRDFHPCHFTLTLTAGMTIATVANKVDEQCGGTTQSMTIFRYVTPADRVAKGWDDTPLEGEKTLSDYGYVGGSRTRPKTAVLCYDFLPVLSNCPLLNAGQVFKSQTSRPGSVPASALR